ncbi:ATP/GTP-binding protein [Nostocales cyanobacterium LEGE 11386]|nr:ATP/GTP-binding protein [Nostocales cyanobacterium LEGE 11386]
MTVGDARVGKSTVCKLLIDLLHSQGKAVKAYDHDNFQKLQAYKNLITVNSLDFFRNETDQILEDFKNQQLEIIIVDMPGQYVDKICNYIDNSSLFQLLDKYNWRLTFIQPISHRLDCLQYMETILNFSRERANFIVIKNYHFDHRFKNYYSSLQNKLYSAGGIDLILNKLHTDHYEAMERTNKPYSQIREDRSIYILYRSYIYRWMQNFNQLVLENQVASNYLGLSNCDF